MIKRITVVFLLLLLCMCIIILLDDYYRMQIPSDIYIGDVNLGGLTIDLAKGQITMFNGRENEATYKTNFR